MKKENWIWMPHPGHFICSSDCRFILNTYVGKYIVSTVGELWSDQAVRRIHAEVWDKKWYLENKDKKGDTFNSIYMKKFGYQDIGLDREYETMVFEARKAKSKCCPYRIIVEKEVDEKHYNTGDDAYEGHLNLCKKWSNK